MVSSFILLDQSSKTQRYSIFQKQTTTQPNHNLLNLSHLQLSSMWRAHCVLSPAMQMKSRGREEDEEEEEEEGEQEEGEDDGDSANGDDS